MKSNLLAAILVILLAIACGGTAQAQEFLQVSGLARGDTLNVRSGPGTSNGVVGTIMQGEVVENLGCRSSWCQVASTMGVRGWASKRYLVAYGSGGVVQRPSASGVAQTTKCPRSPNACIAEAMQICGGSYAVLDSESHAGGIVSDALPGPVTWYQMTYQCGPSNGMQPNFAFRGPSPGIAVPSQLPSFGGGMAVAVSDMGRYCVGEASAYFGQRPQNMATLPVEQYGGQYIVYGQFPPDGSNVTTFQCYFDGGGEFLRVQ